MRFFFPCCSRKSMLGTKKKVSAPSSSSSSILSSDPSSIPYFTFRHREIIGYPCHIYDGDTFSIVFKKSAFFCPSRKDDASKDIDSEDGEWTKYRCRMYGYDSPEIRPLLKTPNRESVIEKARLAKQRLHELLMRNPEGWIKIECGDFDKYGRILVKVWNGVDEVSVNDIMLREGHGYPYFGGTKMQQDCSSSSL